ncbi:MAG: NAD(P)/FAD-dependent oxidoreductase [Flavobacteriales bacterium]
MQRKFLIIGGGLSGLLLARALKKQGVSVRVIDDGKNQSSVIAAGLVNPISFRRTLLSWNAHVFYPYAKTFYEAIQKTTAAPLFQPLLLRRIFSSEQEAATWKERLNSPEFVPFLLPSATEDLAYGPFGSGRVTGFSVDGKALLEILKQDVEIIQALFLPTRFDPEKGSYDGDVYEKIIFCCGYRNSESPFFNGLPVQSTKGQLLLVSWDNGRDNTSYHRKCFAIPKGDKRFKVGATFEWGDETLEPTKEAREKLLDDFKSISSDPLRVYDQVVGIRPTTPDRKPILGAHPTYPNLFIFNGLGTKGYLTAPYLADHFTRHLLFNESLDPLVSLSRFER